MVVTIEAAKAVIEEEVEGDVAEVDIKEKDFYHAEILK